MKHSIADEGHLPLRRWLAEATEGVPDAHAGHTPEDIALGLRADVVQVTRLCAELGEAGLIETTGRRLDS